jgi:hypothetical protein
MNKSVKITPTSHLQLEELRLFLLKRRRENVTKTEILGTLISMYSRNILKTNDGEDEAFKI